MDPTVMNRQFKEQGFCVCPRVLSEDTLHRAREALDRGVAMTRETGSTHIATLDPNAANIRVNNLPAIDPIFIELLMHDDALSAVEMLLGQHYLISNFTANIALPGSKSMRLHSDQALVMPPPWPQVFAMNVIWCLDDVHQDNGATLYLPGSHHYKSPGELPSDARERLVPFEAPAGSFIAMDGRLWHTSGSNVCADGQRRMMFAYYSSDFIRLEMNWNSALPLHVQVEMDERTRARFALTPNGHTRIAAQLTAIEPVN